MHKNLKETLEGMPSVRSAQFDEVKFENDNVRVTVSRATVGDGAKVDHETICFVFSMEKFEKLSKKGIAGEKKTVNCLVADWGVFVKRKLAESALLAEMGKLQPVR